MKENLLASHHSTATIFLPTWQTEKIIVSLCLNEILTGLFTEEGICKYIAKGYNIWEQRNKQWKG